MELKTHITRWLLKGKERERYFPIYERNCHIVRQTKLSNTLITQEISTHCIFMRIRHRWNQTKTKWRRTESFCTDYSQHRARHNMSAGLQLWHRQEFVLWDNADQEEEHIRLSLLAISFVLLLSLPAGSIQVTSVTSWGSGILFISVVIFIRFQAYLFRCAQVIMFANGHFCVHGALVKGHNTNSRCRGAQRGANIS